MKPSTERELKLFVDARQVEPLIAHAAASLDPVTRPRTARVRTTYFDTPSCALKAAGVSLRVRKSRGALVQSLKSFRRGNAPAMQRLEREWPLRREGVDFEKLRASLPSGLLRRLETATLNPVFETRVRRTTFAVQRDDALIELAFDRGLVAANGRRRTICEVEAELKQGGRLESLYAIALELQRRADVRVGSPSKAELGYQLLNGEEDDIVKSPPIALPKDVTVAEGFRQAVRTCVAHLLANQAAAVAGAPEGVHQVRVAVRRIRAALRLFRRYLERTAREDLERELRWLGREVGTARDWDAFVDNLFTLYIRDDMAVDTVSQVTGLAHRRAAEAIQSPRYTRLLLRLQRWIEGSGWYADLDAKRRGRLDGPLARAAPRMLARMADAVDKRAKHMQRLSGVERHSLRKQAKKLRYSVEFLAAFHAGRAGEYHKRLKKLLRTLGRINDLSAARNLLDSAGAEHWAVKALASDYADSLSALSKSWKRFAGVPRFWENA